MDEQLVKPLNDHEQQQSVVIDERLDVRKKKMDIEASRPLVVEQGMGAALERKRRKLKEKKQELMGREKQLFEKQLGAMRDEIEHLKSELVIKTEKCDEMREMLLNEKSKSIFQARDTLLAKRR